MEANDLSKYVQRFVYGDTDYNLKESDEEDFDPSLLLFVAHQMKLSDTHQEQLENKLAIKEQVAAGVIDEFGVPNGFTYEELGIPKEVQEQHKLAKAHLANQKRAAQGLAPLPNVTQNRPYQAPQPPKLTGLAKQAARAFNRDQDKAKRIAEANAKISQHLTNNGEFNKYNLPPSLLK